MDPQKVPFGYSCSFFSNLLGTSIALITGFLLTAYLTKIGMFAETVN